MVVCASALQTDIPSVWTLAFVSEVPAPKTLFRIYNLSYSASDPSCVLVLLTSCCTPPVRLSWHSGSHSRLVVGTSLYGGFCYQSQRISNCILHAGVCGHPVNVVDMEHRFLLRTSTPWTLEEIASRFPASSPPLPKVRSSSSFFAFLTATTWTPTSCRSTSFLTSRSRSAYVLPAALTSSVSRVSFFFEGCVWVPDSLSSLVFLFGAECLGCVSRFILRYVSKLLPPRTWGYYYYVCIRKGTR